jgi:hypothetical protein
MSGKQTCSAMQLAVVAQTKAAGQANAPTWLPTKHILSS